MGEEAKMNDDEIFFQTFRWTGITFFTAVAIIAMVSGCEDPNAVKPVPPPPPKPTIVIQASETSQSNSLTVTFLNHQRDFLGNNQYSELYVHLKNVEQIREYKEQAEFLLKSLEEAERKMTIHEDNTKTTSP
jgi:hypothetical protein